MVEVRQFGLVPYAIGLDEQARAADQVRRGERRGVVLAVRHPPVITLGRRTGPGDVHVDRATLESLGIERYRVDRGGGATYHYPGQAVVYPVLHLARLHLTVDRLLAALGRVVVDVLAGQGIDGRWDCARPGVYVGDAKIASVGLHLSGDVTTHGLAVNVGSGTEGFGLIDPCRTPGLAVTSIADLRGGFPDADALGLDLARRIAAAVA